MSCVFCDIVQKKAEANIIYENSYVCCFLDKHPINKGHILVVPIKHYTEFTDVDHASLNQIIQAGQKVAKGLEKVFQLDGMTVMQNNGIFKDVEHYQLHIFPRFKNDGFTWIEPNIKLQSEELVQIKDKLIEVLRIEEGD